MKTYVSHKTVQAAKISEVGTDASTQGLRLKFEDGTTADVGYQDSRKFRFDGGTYGYYVEYTDGYISWSPTKAFEEGYTETPQLHDVPAPE